MAVCTQITYRFEELPLITCGNNQGLLAFGKAEIAHYSDDEWYVRAIWLDGIEIERSALPWLYDRVVVALEEHCNDHICDEVRLEEIGTAQRMRAYSRSAA
jgi:hypothetical protein